MREPREKIPKPRSMLAIVFMVLFTVAVTTYWPSSKEDNRRTDTPPPLSGEKLNKEITTSPLPPSEYQSSEKVISPYLLEQQPWKEGEVQAISIKIGGEQTLLSKYEKEILLDALRWTDTTVAKTDVAPSSKGAQLQIKVGTKQSVVIPYDINVNAYEIEGRWYYANHYVFLLMNRVLGQDKKLALFDELQQQATLEEQQAVTDEVEEVQDGKVQIGGLDYRSWQQKLMKETSRWKIPFYDNGTAQISEVINIADEVVMLPGQIVFMDPSYQTKDGIKLGMSKKEVQRIFGAKALKLPSRWSYKVGDYYVFHIYFEQDKVAFLVLTSPLV